MLTVKRNKPETFLFNGEGLMIHAKIVMIYTILSSHLQVRCMLMEKPYCNNVSLNFDVNGRHENTDE